MWQSRVENEYTCVKLSKLSGLFVDNLPVYKLGTAPW